MNPQTLNLYAYTANDPINRTDPDGLFWGALFGFIAGFFKKTSFNFNFNYKGIPFSFGFQGHFKNVYVGIAGFNVQITGQNSIFNRLKAWKNNSGLFSFVDDDKVNKLSQCVKDAIYKFYESVGNSSEDRLKQVKKALDAVTYTTYGFPKSLFPAYANFPANSEVWAFTFYDHIYFNKDRYNPNWFSGLALIVHEFTHVMQYREVASFEAKYIAQYLKSGNAKGGGNSFEQRGYVNEDLSEAYFQANKISCPEK